MTVKPLAVHELSPNDVHDRLIKHEIVLIDVREPQEYAAERIHGALLAPLSTFDPKSLPLPSDREVVLHCGVGRRSAQALAACAAAGVPVVRHMAGGLLAWKAAGLPTVSINPATGRVVDRT
ncbi:MAG: rhodanese-like domain-containing protein [Rhodospirillales bacterium]|nr:rhodanese-like domain-containing protein [Rhodospirillales bacterium]